MIQCNGKNQYKSEHEARSVKQTVLRKRSRQLRVYKCPHCHSWHLTSEPKWDKPENEDFNR